MSFSRRGIKEGQNNERKQQLMKTKLVRNIIAPLLFACALDTMAAAERPPRDGAVGGKLQGTWEMQITLTDCAGHVIRSFPTIVEFVAGGTLTEASGGTAPALATGGKGVWSHTTDSTYAFRFKDFNFNSSYVLTGWSIISGELTVDETGNANGGPATVQVYDANGNLLATLCADAVGTRFEL
jgi:hypothetical protein